MAGNYTGQMDKMAGVRCSSFVLAVAISKVNIAQPFDIQRYCDGPSSALFLLVALNEENLKEQ